MGAYSTYLLVIFGFLAISVVWGAISALWVLLLMLSARRRHRGLRLLRAGVGGCLASLVVSGLLFLGVAGATGSDGPVWPGVTGLLASMAIGFGWAILASLFISRRRAEESH